MKFRKIRFFIIGLTAFGLMSFNWDRVELESRAFVITLAIDADEKGQFSVAMNIPDTRAIAEEKDEEARMFSATGSTLSSAISAIDRKMSNSVYFGHTKTIILGEGLLNNPNLLQEAIDTMERENELNAKSIVLATDKPIADILSAKPHGQSLLGIYVSNFYNNSENSASIMDKLDLEVLIAHLIHGGDAIIPRISIEGDKDEEELIIAGAALITDFALMSFAGEEDLAGLLWFRKGANTGLRTVNSGLDSESHASIAINRSHGNFSFEQENGRLICVADVSIAGHLESYRFLSSDLSNQGNLRNLESLFEESISKEINELFKFFREDVNIDGFDLRDRLHKLHYGLYRKYGADDEALWAQLYQDMVFRPQVSVRIIDTGAVK